MYASCMVVARPLVVEGELRVCILADKVVAERELKILLQEVGCSESHPAIHRV